MRRLPAILLLVAVTAAVVWTLIARPMRTTAPVDPWTAVPGMAVAVLEVPQAIGTWDRMTHSSALWAALSEAGAAVVMDSLMTRLRLRTTAEAPGTDDPTMLFALVRTSARHSGLLVICPMPASASTTLADVLHLEAGALDSLIQGERMPCSPLADGPMLHLSARKGLLLLATDDDVLETALLHLQANASTPDSLVDLARRTFGSGVDAHLLVRMPMARGLLAAHLRTAAADALDMPDGIAALDVRVRPDVLLMSGVVIGGSTATAAQEGDLDVVAVPRILPERVHLLSSQHLPLEIMAPTDGRPVWLAGPLQVGTAYAADSTATWTVLRTSDPQAMSDALRDMRRDDPGCDSLAHRGMALYRADNNSVLTRLLGVPDVGMDRPWCALVNDKLVISPEERFLREAIDIWMDGGSLAEDGRTTPFLQRFGIAAATSWWCDVARSRSMFLSWADTSLHRALTDADGTLAALGGFLVQMGTDALGNHLISICVQPAARSEAPAEALWSVDLGAPTEGMPHPLRNHTNNSREVLVQDSSHRIHLINGAGQVLWSRPLDGPILGQVHQVDRFRNGKLQLLMGTATRLYLIDRNGRDVEGSPVEWPAPAAAAPAVFDYENKREYRVLVPLENGQLMNIGLDGKATQGWAPPKPDAPCRMPLRHLRTGAQDHLLAWTTSGGALVLDRRGGQRQVSNAGLNGLREVLGVRAGATIGATVVLWVDSTGAAWRTTFDGSSEPVAPAGAVARRAGLMDTDGDGREEVLCMAGDTLVAWSIGARRVVRVLPGTTSLGPLVMNVGAEPAIIVGLAQRERTHVLDTGGRDKPGSPFAGNTAAATWGGKPGDGLDLVTVTPAGRVIAWKYPAP